MSHSYSWMNRWGSMGLYPHWRKEAFSMLPLNEGDNVADLMCGTGDSWNLLLPKIGRKGKLTAIDFSEGMLRQANRRKAALNGYLIDIYEQNVFDNSLASFTQDAVCCSYGIKTLDVSGVQKLVKEIWRILKPGGHFVLVDICIPNNPWMARLYDFYISRWIPLMGRLVLGSQSNYNKLQTYSHSLHSPDNVSVMLRDQGLEVSFRYLSLNSAYCIYGYKPSAFSQIL